MTNAIRFADLADLENTIEDVDGRLENLYDDRANLTADERAAYEDGEHPLQGAANVLNTLFENPPLAGPLVLLQDDIQADVWVELINSRENLAENIARNPEAWAADDDETDEGKMSVLDYFNTIFPKSDLPLDDDERTFQALASMPLDSTCGDDCKIALDAARVLVERIHMAHGDYPKGVQMVTGLAATVADVCACYITG